MPLQARFDELVAQSKTPQNIAIGADAHQLFSGDTAMPGLVKKPEFRVPWKVAEIMHVPEPDLP